MNVEEIEKRIIKGDDIIGRNEKYKVIELDQKFPDYLLENKKTLKIG